MHFNAITCFSQRSLVCAWARARRYETYPEIEAGLIFLSFFLFIVLFLVEARAVVFVFLVDGIIRLPGVRAFGHLCPRT